MQVIDRKLRRNNSSIHGKTIYHLLNQNAQLSTILDTNCEKFVFRLLNKTNHFISHTLNLNRIKCTYKDRTLSKYIQWFGELNVNAELSNNYVYSLSVTKSILKKLARFFLSSKEAKNKFGWLSSTKIFQFYEVCWLKK